MKYLVIKETESDIYIEDLNSLEEANKWAKSSWDNLTNLEKSNSHIYVLKISEENYNKVENDETEKTYWDFEIEDPNTFNSKRD